MCANLKAEFKPIDVLFCGLIKNPQLYFDKQLKELYQLRKEKVVNKIILATWDYELKNYPKVIKELRKNQVEIMLLREPKDRGFGNIYCQTKTLREGLKASEDGRFVLKTRVDMYIRPEFIRKLASEKETLLKINHSLPNGNIFKYKVWFPWYEFKIPFFLADECFFGTKEDLALFNYDGKEYDEEYEIGVGNVHIRRFVHPFIEKYPIFRRHLEKKIEKETIRPQLVKFLDKYYDFRKIKLLKRTVDLIKYLRISKRLLDDEYVKTLAAYYVILESHFWIDSRTFKDQIIFRENTEPRLKLDNETLENNFSKKFIFNDKYRDIVIVHDNEFLENFANRKLKKTPLSEKFYKYVDEFYSK